VIIDLICVLFLMIGILLLSSFHLRYNLTIISFMIACFFSLSSTRLLISYPEINLSIYLAYFLMLSRLSFTPAYIINGFDLWSNADGCKNFLLKPSAVRDFKGTKLCNLNPASPKLEDFSSSKLFRILLFGSNFPNYLYRCLILSFNLSILSRSLLIMPLRYEKI